MNKKTPTKLCQTLEEQFKGARYLKKDLAKLKNPPYFEDCQPHIDSYTSKIRSMQKIVRDQVGNLKLRLTETDGEKYNHLFDSNPESVSTEFENWGLGGVLDNFMFTNTGHLWITVDSARFKSGSHGAKSECLGKIKKIRKDLKGLYKPIEEFYHTVKDYMGLLERISFLCTGGDFSSLVEENKRISKVKERYLSKTYIIRIGVLSRPFADSLIHRLEQSFDLAKSHPGG